MEKNICHMNTYELCKGTHKHLYMWITHTIQIRWLEDQTVNYEISCDSQQVRIGDLVIHYGLNLGKKNLILTE